MPAGGWHVPRVRMRSLRSTLDVVRPYLPEELVSPADFDRVSATVQHLPAEVTQDIYFECRLGSHASRADLVVGVYHAGRSIIAGAGFHPPAGNNETASKWLRLRSFCQEWENPASRLHTLVDHIWLEYDAPCEPARSEDHAAADAFPSLFIALNQLDGGASPCHSHAVYALNALGWRVHDDTAASALRTCFEHLPPAGRIEYVGLMLGRPESTIRLCVIGMAADAVGHYLGATTRFEPHRAMTFARAASATHGPDGIPRVGMVHIDIDARDGVLKRIGMERTFVRPCQDRGALADDDLQFLRHLTASGLCSSAKRQALALWPGRSVAVMPSELWWSVVSRRINHIKFVIEPSGAVAAKAYLFSQFRAQRRTRSHARQHLAGHVMKKHVLKGGKTHDEVTSSVNRTPVR